MFKVFKKNRMLLCFFISLFVGIVGVSAVTYFESNIVTYDNSVSGLNSTNLQEAIDELYTECTETKGGASILDRVTIVTSGDGLYEDEYESGRYFYKGSNPNNYITFNNENAGWRIISVEADGTIKIIRNEYLPNQKVFDSAGRRTLGYCRNNDYGCHAWAKTDYFSDETAIDWPSPGEVESDSELNIYLNEDYYSSLIKTAQNQIVNHEYNVGTAIDYIGGDIGNYENESALLYVINEESSYSWNGKIGLISLSEILRTNSNISLCSNPDGNRLNYGTCMLSNWIMNSDKYETWMISPRTTYNDYVYVLGTYDFEDTFRPYNQYYVRPVLYLSSDVKLSGTGTQSNPYQIE